MTCSLNLPQSRLSSPKAAPTETWRHSPSLVRVTANTTLTSTPSAEFGELLFPHTKDASGASSAGVCLLPVLPAEYHLREDGFPIPVDEGAEAKMKVAGYCKKVDGL